MHAASVTNGQQDHLGSEQKERTVRVGLPATHYESWTTTKPLAKRVLKYYRISMWSGSVQGHG